MGFLKAGFCRGKLCFQGVILFPDGIKSCLGLAELISQFFVFVRCLKQLLLKCADFFLQGGGNSACLFFYCPEFFLVVGKAGFQLGQFLLLVLLNKEQSVDLLDHLLAICLQFGNFSCSFGQKSFPDLDVITQACNE